MSVTKAGFINGSFVTGEGDTLTVECPSTEEEFESLPGLSAAQVEQGILAAREAFDNGSWTGLSGEQRAAALGRFLDALDSRKEALVDIIVREAGCPRHSHSMMIQVAQPLRQMREVIELFLGLPETEDNPVPLDQ